MTETEFLQADDPAALEQALTVLLSGGLVVFPTDTVYGLGVAAFDAEAVDSIYRAKRRPPDRSIPVLLGDVAHLALVAADIQEYARALAAAFWPGPLTLVVPKHPALPAAVSASGTVAVRVPDHPVALDLLKRAGPLAVTSANLSDHPAARTASEARAQLDGRVHVILDGGPVPGGMPSTIVDCTGIHIEILRGGPISSTALLACLR